MRLLVFSHWDGWDGPEYLKALEKLFPAVVRHEQGEDVHYYVEIASLGDMKNLLHRLHARHIPAVIGIGEGELKLFEDPYGELCGLEAFRG